MKKLLFSAMTIGMLSFFSPLQAKEISSRNPEPTVTEKKMDAKEVEAMIKRIDEIKAMDFKALSTDEKKALKKELKGMKQDLKVVTGVYLSTGAIILVLILLLILL